MVRIAWRRSGPDRSPCRPNYREDPFVSTDIISRGPRASEGLPRPASVSPASAFCRDAASAGRSITRTAPRVKKLAPNGAASKDHSPMIGHVTATVNPPPKIAAKLRKPKTHQPICDQMADRRRSVCAGLFLEHRLMNSNKAGFVLMTTRLACTEMIPDLPKTQFFLNFLENPMLPCTKFFIQLRKFMVKLCCVAAIISDRRPFRALTQTAES